MEQLSQSFVADTESFGVATACIIAVLAALLITGIWEYVIQEIRLKRAEQKHRAADRLRQNTRVALLLTYLFVTGCTATQRANIDDAKCQADGTRCGSRAYVQCRATLEATRQQ